MSADSRARLDPRPTRVRPVGLAEVADLVGPVRPLDPSHGAVRVRGVSLTSLEVRAGDLYAALPGSRTHGARFVGDAAGCGAVAVLTDAEGADIVGTTDLPVLVVDEPRARLGELAALVFGDPAERVTTLGITGTQGKTTCTYLAESALRAAGARTALIGTIGARIDGHDVGSRLTTPEAPQLHALFGVMAERGVDACAMEVSSHALVQGRVDGVVFDVAAFVNLGRDHLDFHASLEDYFEAKAALFTPERARRAVVNVDDPYGQRLAEQTALPVTTVSTIVSSTETSADWHLLDADHGPLGSTVGVRGPDVGRLDLSVPLPGSFNVTNALVVLAALATVGYDPEALAAGIAACRGVPGRMERVEAGQDFAVVVDYAHKPDALEAVLSALRRVSRGRLLLVIGAGGDRDTGKRPLMGEVAARWCDIVVVTDDNPRTEDPAGIRAQVLAGARAGERPAELVEVEGRRAGIAAALDMARPGDTVVVAGKGHEPGQEIDGVVHPFDDRDEVRRALAAREVSM